MGHVRVYTISDCFARYYAMNRRFVIHPMGWDAFGLPAENAAILNKVNPAEWTMSNIDFMRDQLRSLGLSFQYSTFATCEESYYKQTQRLFLQLYKERLAYQGFATVHWDPVDQTVLANEQVDAEGRSWRSGALVEKRDLKQWFLRITDYSEPLLKGLDTVDWPSDVVAAQKQWIGRSEGHVVEFPLTHDDAVDPQTVLKIFTTRIDTLNYVDFLAVSVDHPLAREFPKTTRLPLHAVVGNKKIPVFAAEYVLSDYGCGAIMGVPRHDERDAAFAAAHGIPSLPDEDLHHLRISATATYHLRDWLVSRQRYWGCPIPIIHCPKCGPVPVPDRDLPVRLPSKITSGPLSQDQEWSSVPCPCDERLPSRRESDTLDTFVDSSFYFHRYLDIANPDEIVSQELRDKYLPVDLYIGGKEHACMHLLYARFVDKVLMNNPSAEPFTRLLTQGMVLGKTRKTSISKRYLLPGEAPPTHESVVEVFEKMSKSKFNGISPSELLQEHGADVLRLYTLFKAPPHLSLEWDERDIVGVKRWVTRVWNLVHAAAAAAAAAGTQSLLTGTSGFAMSPFMLETARFISHVVEKSHSLNTAVAALMKASTQLQKDLDAGREIQQDLLVFLQLLVPFAPFLAHESASVLGIDQTKLMVWPLLLREDVGNAVAAWQTSGDMSPDAAAVMATPPMERTVVVQINGKTKGTMTVSVEKLQQEPGALPEPDIRSLAMEKIVGRHLSRTGQVVKRVIIPPTGKLINFVVA